MEKEEKKDLAPETGKVEEVNIKLDASGVEEAIKKAGEKQEFEVAQELEVN